MTGSGIPFRVREKAIAGRCLMSAGCASVQTPGRIPGIVALGVEPELVQEGFVFTEGPLGTADGGLYFTDLRPSNDRKRYFEFE